MRVLAALNHADALAILRDAGVSAPAIPPGKNTVWKHFRTNDGHPAVAVNQTGFARELEDNEEEVNGLCVFIAPDNDPGASDALEAHIMEQLGLQESPAVPRGRPATGRDSDAVVRLRLPRTEKAGWVKRAQAQGMTLSAWIRERCR